MNIKSIKLEARLTADFLGLMQICEMEGCAVSTGKSGGCLGKIVFIISA
jgi:hypothetical protein